MSKYDSAEIVSTSGSRETLRLSSGQLVTGFHGPNDCYSDICAVHSPSDHSMRTWPLAFSGSHMIRVMPNVSVGDNYGSYIPEYSEKTVLVTIDPDDYLYRENGYAIIRNSATCGNCGDKIVSRYRHDYVECDCGESFVDGGDVYIRQGGKAVDTSLVFRDSEDD